MERPDLAADGRRGDGLGRAEGERAESERVKSRRAEGYGAENRSDHGADDHGAESGAATSQGPESRGAQESVLLPADGSRGQLRRTAPWVIVAVLIAGAVTVGAGLIAGLWYVMVIGAAVILLGIVAAVLLPRAGLSAPVSLASEFPADTPGPRGAPDGAPRLPVDTAPAPEPDLSPYRTVEERPASTLPQNADTERAKPQYVNLAPDERIRRIGGRDVIEVPDEESPEDHGAG